jgi:simple sugar transport system permease protein
MVSGMELLVPILEMSPVFSLAAFGQLLGQKSGVYDLGVEGTMTTGAVFGVLGAYMGLNSWGCLLLGSLVGIPFGAALFFVSEKLKLNQIVVGFGLWLIGLGLAGSIYTVVLAPQHIEIEAIHAVAFGLDPIFYLSIGLLVFLIFLFSRTKYGLIVTAVGENPRVADTAGISVEKVRAICVVIGSALAGLAGSYVAVDVVQGFTYTMIAGYGWMAFALVIFGRWKPIYVFAGSLLFVAITGISARMEILGMGFLPPNYVAVLPYIGVLVVLTLAMIFAKETGMPAGLGQPYTK